MTIFNKHVTNKSVILYEGVLVCHFKFVFILPESECPFKDCFVETVTSAASLRQASSC